MASCFPKIDRQRRKRKPSAAPAAAVGVGVVDEEQGKSNNRRRLDDRPLGFLFSRRKDPPVSFSGGDDNGNKFAGGGTRWNDGDFSIGCVTDEEGTNIVMEHQTKMIQVLRAVVFLLLVSLATVVCVGVFLYTKREEEYSFRQQYEAAADDVLESFYEAVERKLEAVESMSTAITSYALSDNKTFPFVTMPNFAVLGSAMRVQAEASILHWMPLVHENQRKKWEEYATNNRHQIDEAFLQDKELRHKQDVAYGYADKEGARLLLDETDDAGEELLSEEELVFVAGDGVDCGDGTAADGGRDSRLLEKKNAAAVPMNNESIFDDGTGFHPHLWSTGAITPRGDEPIGRGPYLPLWQRSPISGAKQKLLNINFANTKVFSDVLPVVLRTHQAVMNSAQVPLPKYQEQFRKNLAISQYRHNIAEVLEDPHTFMGYPVFDSFDMAKRKVVGLLAVSLYWKLFFKNILPANTMPMICVLENSFNQTIAYKIEGPVVTFLGKGDPHDVATEPFMRNASVNEDVEQLAGPETRSYTSVRLNQEFGQYMLRIYPAEAPRLSNQPWAYAITVACTFLVTSVVYLMFACAVEKRQEHVMHAAIRNARKAAVAERELNEFLAHEVRNPLAAAISAYTFVDAAIHEGKTRRQQHDDASVGGGGGANNDNYDFVIDGAAQKSLEEDVNIIGSSLHFINDFLRSMLDIHRAAANQIELKLKHTDVFKDILEPVCSMLHQRDADVEVIVECPENLIVATDPLRVKQVVLNLGRNATKFVQSGFIRLRAAVVADNMVELYVEDSGPGIPHEKRDALFQKYQTSLDLLSQGTGIGLCLSKNLMNMLKGNLYLDQEYRSGIANQPGAGFVIQLRQPPVKLTMQMSGLFGSSRSLNFRKEDDIASAMEGGSLSEVKLQDDALAGNNQSLPPPAQHFASDIASPSAQPPSGKDDERRHLPEGWRVLVVDDDLMLRKIFSLAIEKVAPSWTVDECANGETALRMTTGNGGTALYDLIFIDQHMASAEKQLLGTETVRLLRAQKVTSLLVGLSATDLTQPFLQAGADTFLSKPIPTRSKDVYAALRRITASRKPSTPEDINRSDTEDKEVYAAPSQSENKNDHVIRVKNEKSAPGQDETSGTDSVTAGLGIATSVEHCMSPSTEDQVLPAFGQGVISPISSSATTQLNKKPCDATTEQLPDNISILFVDDDPMLRKLFSRAIKKVAPTWSIHEAASGEKALQLVESETFGVIFMDQYMSSTEKRLLGTETVAALRGRGVTSVICGLSANEMEDAFVSAGADFFLPKPIPCRPADLKREMRRITRSITIRNEVDRAAGSTALTEDATSSNENEGSPACTPTVSQRDNKRKVHVEEEKTALRGIGVASKPNLFNIPATSIQEELPLTPFIKDAMDSALRATRVSSGDGLASAQQRLNNNTSRQGSEDTSVQLPEDLSILFVDDDPMLRKLFSRAVKKVAPTWSIHEASSGEEALELVGSQSFGLIFMDQYMSSTEKQLLGTETVETLRSKGVTSVICGLSANEMEDAFVSAGANFFLPKPIPCRPKDLKRELHRITRSIVIHKEANRAAEATTRTEMVTASKETEGSFALKDQRVEDKGEERTCHGTVSKTNVLDEPTASKQSGSPVTPFITGAAASALRATQTSSGDGLTNAQQGHNGNDGRQISEDMSGPLPEDLAILFVDDDSMLRKLFSRAVKKVAPTWSIHEASSGEKAMELVDSQNYGLIFMDQYMSSTEKQLLGTETVEALRSKGVTSIICGLSANEMEQAFVTAGADYFLPKPIPCRPSDLTRELRRLTRKENNHSPPLTANTDKMVVELSLPLAGENGEVKPEGGASTLAEF